MTNVNLLLKKKKRLRRRCNLQMTSHPISSLCPNTLLSFPKRPLRRRAHVASIAKAVGLKGNKTFGGSRWHFPTPLLSYWRSQCHQSPASSGCGAGCPPEPVPSLVLVTAQCPHGMHGKATKPHLAKPTRLVRWKKGMSAGNKYSFLYAFCGGGEKRQQDSTISVIFSWQPV